MGKTRMGRSFVDSFGPETRMALDFEPADPATARPALTVSALNRAVAGLLERSFPLVRVQGEIANLTRAASGHWYFTLKDDAAQVRCVMFRSRAGLLAWTPRQGDEVEATAVVCLYEPRGEFQLTVEFLSRAGLGRLFEEFQRLKQRLAAEGLFEPARKRALPRLPRVVGIVTSLQAAALTDVLTALRRRAPYLRAVVYPVPVQGAGAGEQIAAMLATVSARRAVDQVDVVLLVRGGGSIEDLWAFNEEVVARAIVVSALPVVVGVGHDSDFTIADFAADLRAPTPTAAAELAAPAGDALRDTVATQLRHLARRLEGRLQTTAQRLDYAQRRPATPRAAFAALDARVGVLRSRALAAMARTAGSAAARADALRARWMRARPDIDAGRALQVRERLAAAARARMTAARLRLQPLAARLAALDPHAVLARGYAIALDGSGRAVTDAAVLRVGVPLRVLFAQGVAGTRVESVEPGEPADPDTGTDTDDTQPT